MTLKKQIDTVRKQMNKLRGRLDTLREQFLLKEMIPLAKKSIGKTFKYLNSGHRFIDEKWWHYVKIVDVSSQGEFICNKIDVYPDKSAKLEFLERHHSYDGECPFKKYNHYIETKPEIFDEVWRKQLLIMAGEI